MLLSWAQRLKKGGKYDLRFYLNSPTEIKINSAKLYKFLFLLKFLITVAIAKNFLVLSLNYYQLNAVLILTIFVNDAKLLLLMLLGRGIDYF